jgi:hypothetical protein
LCSIAASAYRGARAEFEHAASLARNGPERALLLERAADCTHRLGEADRARQR